MLLKVNLVKQKEKEMTRSLEEIQADKKNAVAEVKKLILQYNLTKGDIRGKALKQLEL